MDAGSIDSASHDAVKGVNFAHQLAFPKTADGRVAGHLANGLETMGQKQRLSAAPSRSRGRFRTGVAATNDNYIVVNHSQKLGAGCQQVKHPHNG